MEPSPEEAPRPPRRSLPLLVVVGAFALVFMALGIGAFWLKLEKRRANERTAIGCLRAFGSAQSIFREADKDQDNYLDYGTLAELRDTGLVDACVGSGTYEGYVFQMAPSASTSEFLWFATANPEEPGLSGDRAFCVNQAGVVFYTTTGSFALNTTNCNFPPSALPIGRR